MDKQTLTEQLLAERDKGPRGNLFVEAAKSDIERGIDARRGVSALQQVMMASQNLHNQQGPLQNRPFTTGMTGQAGAPVGQSGLFGLFGASIY